MELLLHRVAFVYECTTEIAHSLMIGKVDMH